MTEIRKLSVLIIVLVFVFNLKAQNKELSLRNFLAFQEMFRIERKTNYEKSFLDYFNEIEKLININSNVDKKIQSLEVIVNLIANTTTETGLKVKAFRQRNKDY